MGPKMGPGILPRSFPSHHHYHHHYHHHHHHHSKLTWTEAAKRWHKVFLMAYRALADHHNVARSTLHDCAHGQRSRGQKAQSEQYLTPYEEKAVVNFLLQIAEVRQPI